MPKVSIIIAIYNVERYLEKCLASALGQSFRDLEVIAINDGSQDGCKDILSLYQERDPRLIIIDKANGGLSDARNAGLRVARGRYIGFLDGDDSYEPDFIAHMLVAIEDNNADLVCCNYAYTYKSGLQRRDRNYLSDLPGLLSKEQALSGFLQEKLIASVTIKLFRRDIIQGQGIVFPVGQMWEDISFTFEYLKHVKKVAVLKESLYNYYQSEVSITRSTETLHILDFIVAVRSCTDWVGENYKDTYRRECSCFFTKAYICLLVYSFKCRDVAIVTRLRGELKENLPATGLSLLRTEEKLLVLLCRTSYPVSRWVYWCLHKRTKKHSLL